MTKNLRGIYADWRKLNEELENDGLNVSSDCGEVAVREDFTGYAGLEKEISFEGMYALEKDYKGVWRY